MNSTAAPNPRVDLVAGVKSLQTQPSPQAVTAATKATATLHNRPANNLEWLAWQPQQPQQSSLSPAVPVHGGALPSSSGLSASAVTTVTPSSASTNGVSAPAIVNKRLSQKAVQPEKTPQQVCAVIASSSDADFNFFIKQPGSALELIRKTAAGHNVMHLAAENNDDKVLLKLFTTHFAADQILEKDIVGAIPLMLASEKGQAEAVTVLLTHKSYKSQLKAVTKYGDNALMLAAAAGHLPVVKLLLRAGCAMRQVKSVNKAGLNALATAVQCKHDAIAALLRTY